MKMTPKNILVLSYIHEGGEWIATQRLIKKASNISKQYRFFLVGYTEGHKTNLDCFEKIVYVEKTTVNPPFRFFKTIFLDIFNVKKAIRNISEEIDKIDCILATHYLMIFPIFFVNKVTGKKLIFLFHGTKSIPIKKLSNIDYRNIVINILERLSLILSSHIAIPSLYAEKFVRSLIHPFDKKKKFHIIPNSIPGNLLNKIPQKELLNFRKKNKISKNAKVILYSGRIVEYKGLENLVDAFINFLIYEKDSILLFAYPQSSSNTELLSQLKTKISKNGALSKVKFFRNPTSENLAKLYKISDVLVLASDLEMAPLAIIESLSCETPCISTKVGNAGEILSKIDSKLLLKSNSPNEILSKLKYFFSLEKTQLQIIKNKSQSITKNYSDLKSAKIFVQTLESIVT